MFARRLQIVAALLVLGSLSAVKIILKYIRIDPVASFEGGQLPPPRKILPPPRKRRGAKPPVKKNIYIDFRPFKKKKKN